MWRNDEVRSFVDWLRSDNEGKSAQKRTAFYGLDLYSLYTSIGEVLRYLDRIDPETAGLARHRYGCLTPWQNDPAAYGHAALTGAYRICERDVVHMLREILATGRILHGDRMVNGIMTLVHNARLVASAERYYRIMYYGSRASWNLRDSHMFETLRSLLPFTGLTARRSSGHIIPTWEMRRQPRCRRAAKPISANFAGRNLVIAPIRSGLARMRVLSRRRSDWDGPMEIKAVQPSREDSYERVFHDTELARFFLPMREVIAKFENRADEIPPGTRNRRHLPARHRTRQPLFPGGASRAVR